MEIILVPDSDKCLAMLKEHRVPGHIIEHSMVVSWVSVFIAEALNRSGAGLDLATVRAGGLLHDIAKHYSINGEGDHAELGAELLEGMGYARLAEIVRYHVRLPEWMPPDQVDELTVVHYGDKRVKHTEIVSLEDRFSDIIERYGTSPAMINRLCHLFNQTRLLEEAIFTQLPFGPEAINASIMESHM